MPRGRAGVRRAGWALADQSLSSLTNVGVAIAIAHEVSAVEFGAFSLAFTVYLFLVGLCRSLTAEPLMVRASAAAATQQRRQVAEATGAALCLGIVAGVACVGIGAGLGGVVGSALVGLGLMVPGLLVQDTWRFAFFTLGRPAQAALNDLIWALAQIGLVAWVLNAGDARVDVLIAAWGLAGTSAALAGAIQAGVVPAPHHTWRWLSDHRDLAPRFAGEFAVRSGARQLTFLAVGAVGGLLALGAIRAAQVLFGPLNTVLLGLPLLAVPEAVRLHARRPQALLPMMRMISAVATLVVVVAAAVVLALPDGIGRELFGATWKDARPVLLPQAALMASIAATSGWLIGLRALGAADRSLVVRLVVAPLTVVGGIGGALLGGAAAATWGIALANWVGVFVWRRQFLGTFRSAKNDAPDLEAPVAPSPAPAGVG